MSILSVTVQSVSQHCKTNSQPISSHNVKNNMKPLKYKVKVSGVCFLISACNHKPMSTQPGHPSVNRCNKYQEKQGTKQAHHTMHYLSILDLLAQAGVWLKTRDTEISTTIWAHTALKGLYCLLLKLQQC